MSPRALKGVILCHRGLLLERLKAYGISGMSPQIASCGRVNAVCVCVLRMLLPNSLLSLQTPIESYEWLVARSPAVGLGEAKAREGQALKSA